MIKGTSATTFSPADHTTRAEFAALLTRTLGLIATDEATPSFTDVTGTEWFSRTGELQAAVDSGIIIGNPDGTFAPNKPVTRAEAATMMSRALAYVALNDDKLDETKELNHFKDEGSIAEWAKEDVEKTLQAGIFTGDERSHFNASASIKRAEVAKAIHHMLQVAELMN
ncbi:S-layer homology domain-containing protein [Bacillaceae bacterium SIJ1]|nr:S-layer homology domain-containing protein [Litoribacterium kuwaitense]